MTLSLPVLIVILQELIKILYQLFHCLVVCFLVAEYSCIGIAQGALKSADSCKSQGRTAAVLNLL